MLEHYGNISIGTGVIHTCYTIQTQQIIFRNINAQMHAITIIEKRGHGRVWRGKEKGEIIISKINRKKEYKRKTIALIS